MKTEDIEKLLEALDESCFPIQIDWNKKDLYIKGLKNALIDCNFEIKEKKENERNAGRKPKITSEQISNIQMLRSQGKKLQEIQDETGISYGNIQKYCKSITDKGKSVNGMFLY